MLSAGRVSFAADGGRQKPRAAAYIHCMTVVAGTKNHWINKMFLH